MAPVFEIHPRGTKNCSSYLAIKVVMGALTTRVSPATILAELPRYILVSSPEGLILMNGDELVGVSGGILGEHFETCRYSFHMYL